MSFNFKLLLKYRLIINKIIIRLHLQRTILQIILLHIRLNQRPPLRHQLNRPLQLTFIFKLAILHLEIDQPVLLVGQLELESVDVYPLSPRWHL